MKSILFLAAALACVVGVRHVAAETGGVQIFGAMPDEQTTGYSSDEDMQLASAGANAQGQTKRLEIQTVDFDRVLEPGSIVVKTQDRQLYFVLPDGKARLYPIGVGREGFTWTGTNSISRKAAWPDWRPPDNMIEREAERGHFIPTFVPGGPKNPLGARALYIGTTQFRIHGTTQPWSIGRAVSSGCIRMLNEHVIDLFDRVEVGARVVVE